MRRHSIAVTICTGLLAASQAFAAERAKPLRGIVGADDRLPIENSAAPWTAIGQINVSGHQRYTRCTGTQVAPRVVLTAAHCVLDPFRRKLYPPQTIHFLAGVNREQNAGHAVAACVKLLPHFDFDAAFRANIDTGERKAGGDFLAQDIAVIVLKSDPGPAAVMTLSGTGLAVGDEVRHAGYHADRRQVLMGDPQCRVTALKGNLALTDCDIAGGGSGGPVMPASGEPVVLGVMVATEAGQGSIAVDLRAWPDLPTDAMCSK